jgi:isopenicillin N synthase-like dioxygenase
MSGMAEDVLDVDLAAFEDGSASARAAVVDGVMRSLGTGFVFTSHSIPDDVLDAAYDGLATFFALAPEAKARWRAPASHGQTGYTGLLVETAATSDVADWKEMLNWGAEVPAHHPLRQRYPHRYTDQVLPDDSAVAGLATALRTLHDQLVDLQARFLRIIAVGLGAAAPYFDDMLVDGSHLTRAVHYPPMASAPSGEHVWADAHGDINLITALPRATERGLQLQTPDGWVDVVPPAGYAIVNSGMMLERLSNGRIPAGVHRVVAPEGFTGDRVSVVQFCHPAPWFQLGPLPSCVDADHPLRYGTIEAGALLDRVLYEIGLIRPD